MTWTREELDGFRRSYEEGKAMREAVQAGRVPDYLAVAAVSRPAGQAQRFEVLPRAKKNKDNTM